MSNPSQIATDKFLNLSEELTGYSLMADLASSHFKAIEVLCRKGFDGVTIKDFEHLLFEYEPDGIADMYANKTYRRIFKEILFLWFTGFPSNRDLSAHFEPNQVGYFEGLLWRSIRAHPPGLTGGYFGHWHYIPEN